MDPSQPTVPHNEKEAQQDPDNAGMPPLTLIQRLCMSCGHEAKFSCKGCKGAPAPDLKVRILGLKLANILFAQCILKQAMLTE